MTIAQNFYGFPQGITPVSSLVRYFPPTTVFVAGPTGNYRTIQEAINAANQVGGGIVYIQPGTYVENIFMIQGVNLIGYIGSSGNIGFTVNGGEVLPITIKGNVTLNLDNATSTPTVEFNNICFTCDSGNLFTITGNTNLLESGYITFNGSQMIAGTSPNYIFSVDGFFNISLNSSEVSETVPGSTNFIQWGATPFLNLNSRNSYVNINAVTALTVPDGSYSVFTLQNTYWSCRLDTSGGVSAFYLNAYQCALDGNGGSIDAPLINFGSNDGSLIAYNCSIISSSGSLVNSTSSSAASVFRFHNCIWNNPLVLGSTGRGEFVDCEFYGSDSAAITMNSGQPVSVSNSVLNSTNNPAIDGSGAGVLSLSGISFSGNSNIANTLTLSASTSFCAGEIRANGDVGGNSGFTSVTATNSTTISTGVGSVKMSSANPGTNTVWIKIYIGTTPYWIPAWSTNAP